jgi:predicted Zn-dependent protease
MNRNFISGAALLMLLSGCHKNFITNKTPLTLIPESTVQSLATTQYANFLSSNKVVSGSTNRDAEMIRRVGNRIANAVTNYYTSQGHQKDLVGYNWEYNLVDSKEVNAWCMPGGKIVVYTGLLPYTQNEAALAVVLGHEITHAIFQHGNQRMSDGLIAQLGGVALSVALSSKPKETQDLFLTAYGVGANVGVLLPFSRKDEYEADHYGLWWAAMAGYNPQEAIPLWERMQKAANGQHPPEFLSTHPSEDNRIERLKGYMPEALGYYKPVGN